MTRLRRFAVNFFPVLLVGACAQLIGLSDFEKGEAQSHDGDGGEGNESSGGSSGTGAKGGDGGAGDSGGGTAGTLPTGGRGARGGAGGDGGAAGEGGETGTGGSTGGGGPGGSGGNGQGGTGGSGGSPPCIEVTAMTLVDQLIDRSIDPHLVSYGFDISPGIGLTSTPDLLEIQFWNGDPYDGILTGEFPLGVGRDSNNSTCSRCILAYQDPDATASLRKLFFQTEGTLTIDAASQQMDGFPTLTYSDVTLREATIDENDFHSTIVPGGACLHFESGSYALPAEWNCDPDWQNDSDCDCGCGIPDPTCTTDEDTACDLCWCFGEDGDCVGFESPTKNWMCL